MKSEKLKNSKFKKKKKKLEKTGNFYTALWTLTLIVTRILQDPHLPDQLPVLKRTNWSHEEHHQNISTC